MTMPRQKAYRQRFVKDPPTSERQARPNPKSEWIIQQVPERWQRNDQMLRPDRDGIQHLALAGIAKDEGYVDRS